MPSIFARHRRASSDQNASDPLNTSPSGSPISNKRRSMDVGRPPVSGNKFKSIFTSHHDEGEGKKEGVLRRLSNASQIFGEGDDGKNGSLRKRLSSASQIFGKQPDSATTASSPVTPQTPSRPPGAGARYDDPAPRSPRSPNSQFASPTLFPENFTLSSTNSPEGSRGSRRGSVTWQPSYPIMVPDDSYADLAPDGHPATNRLSATSATLPSENQHRRSLLEAERKEQETRENGNGQIPTPSPDERSDAILVDPRKALGANGQIPTPSPDEYPTRPITPPAGPTALLTPPPSATTPQRTLEEEEDASRASLDTAARIQPTAQDSTETTSSDATASTSRPSLSVVTNSPEEVTASLPAVTAATDSPVATAGTSSAPNSAHPTGISRPGVPPRRTTLIQSPPMPQPIKNLPSMVGWPAFMRDGAPGTPGWGQANKEGAPKTPGWSGGVTPRTPGWASMISPLSARIPSTPGGTSFPFSLPQTAVGQNKGKGRDNLTEGELRKHRRAMPVMLRQPSTKPVEHEGGEVGASDDDDEESETEVEGNAEDDSEPETETDKAVKKPSVPLKNRLRGKGKGKAKANQGVSALATTALREEDDTATSPGELAQTNEAKKGKSFWSLPTPSSKIAPSWTSFASTPSATPAVPPSTTSRTQSSTGSEITDGYFGSNPASSTASLGTPRNSEPILTKAGHPVQGLGLGAVVAARAEAAAEEDGQASDDDASDEGGSADSHGMSSQDHTMPADPSPRMDVGKPDMSPKRPSFYSRTSRSMVDLASNSNATGPPPTIGTKLETIRSREAAPGKIELPAKSPFSALQHMMTPGSEWAKPPPTPAAGRAGFFWQKTKEGKEIGTLKRRRSMDDLTTAPPKYEPPFPGVVIPKPRDEEGKEKLPKYWCAVHIEGNLSRKMEFSQPGVQSRDRSWKKHYFILRGTSLLVYKFDPHKFPLKNEPAQPIPTATEDESEEHLHVHVAGERRGSISIASPAGGRRGSVPDAAAIAGRRGSLPGSSSNTLDAARRASGSDNLRRSSVTSSIGAASPSSASSASGEKDPALFPNTGRSRAGSLASSTHSVGTSSIASHFQQNQLVKQYTLQNAESGLAADYVKRKNVVRVRAEGEQFLLQTESAREVVDWIEAFQAATNVSLDLDDRPMPKIITLPRRRRRRVPGAAGAAGAATTAGADANPAEADTPAGNAAAVAAAERAAGERDRMLSEDQAAGQTANG